MLFSSLAVSIHAHLLTKSNMAAVGHIEKVIFFVSYTIFTCSTSNVTNFGEILIVKVSSSIQMIYGSDAKLLRSIQFPTFIKNLWYAVKTSIGNFVIINYE